MFIGNDTFFFTCQRIQLLFFSESLAMAMFIQPEPSNTKQHHQHFSSQSLWQDQCKMNSQPGPTKH